MKNISAVILTRNEEKNILDCIESLTGFDQIVIVDDNSSDRTIEIAKKINNDGIEVYKRELDGDFSSQRNFGLSKSKNDWVFFIDADERAGRGLYTHLRDVVSLDNNVNGYYIQRKDIIWGKKLMHGETGNIKLLRLGRKDSGKWKGKVHEVWEITGSTESLNAELAHYPHRTIAEFVREIGMYSSLRAKELFDSGKRTNLAEIIFYPKAKFFINYFVKLGFMDGIPGLLVATMMSFHSYLVRSKLWLLSKNS